MARSSLSKFGPTLGASHLYSDFRLGLLFRQPNLASVTNIFILPFSRTVWIAISSLLIIAYAIISWQLWVESRIHKKLPMLSSGEVFSFITGVVSQQGKKQKIVLHSHVILNVSRVLSWRQHCCRTRFYVGHSHILVISVHILLSNHCGSFTIPRCFHQLFRGLLE